MVTNWLFIKAHEVVCFSPFCQWGNWGMEIKWVASGHVTGKGQDLHPCPSLSACTACVLLRSKSWTLDTQDRLALQVTRSEITVWDKEVCLGPGIMNGIQTRRRDRDRPLHAEKMSKREPTKYIEVTMNTVTWLEYWEHRQSPQESKLDHLLGTEPSLPLNGSEGQFIPLLKAFKSHKGLEASRRCIQRHTFSGHRKASSDSWALGVVGPKRLALCTVSWRRNTDSRCHPPSQPYKGDILFPMLCIS